MTERDSTDNEKRTDTTAPGTPSGMSNVDSEDGGPGSHNEDASGGTSNDPASGGVSAEPGRDE